MQKECPIDWTEYTPQDQAVLCFLVRDGRVLLIHKKRGLGAGKVNGPGGKREAGESLVLTATRELYEEVGIIPENPDHRGTLRFAFSDGYNLEVHIFTAPSWSGEPVETAEAIPFWVRLENIPFDRMWEDDIHWLPAVLAGRRVDGEMCFDGDRMLCWDIRWSDGTRISGKR
ncbi:MAG: 8-oxo-dGTP diphosphatase [Spirochaetaceae bacterium]|nr:MAG: 8-oxo-dGTP diphosphatase [Spirochaetaceae bacterium]